MIYPVSFARLANTYIEYWEVISYLLHSIEEAKFLPPAHCFSCPQFQKQLKTCSNEVERISRRNDYNFLISAICKKMIISFKKVTDPLFLFPRLITFFNFFSDTWKTGKSVKCAHIQWTARPFVEGQLPEVHFFQLADHRNVFDQLQKQLSKGNETPPHRKKVHFAQDLHK